METPPWHPTLMILGPGGVKGFLELGAIDCLSRRGILTDITTIVGVSVGAMIGVLYAAGYTIAEITGAAIETDLFSEPPHIFLNDIKDYQGLISHDILKQKINFLLIQKFNRVPTLGELHELTHKHFVAVTTNLNHDRPEYLDHLTHPDLPTTEAVLMSMNIPIFFHRIFYQGSTFIDGAFSDPLPIVKYDDLQRDIIAITIDSSSSELGDGFVSYMTKTLQCSMTRLKRLAMEAKSNRVRHLDIKTDIRDVIGFSVGTVERALMFCQGNNQAEAFAP